MFSIMIGIITVIVLPTSEDAPMRHFNLHSFFNFTAIVLAKLAKTEHSHPLGMVVSTHFRCGKGVKRGLKNGALPFNID